MAHQAEEEKIKTSPETDAGQRCSLLDLPELALDGILEKLDPAGLLNMSWTCRLLRIKCRGDLLWEKQLRRKWGDVIGGAAQRHWQELHFISGIDSLSRLTNRESSGEVSRKAFGLPDDSVMCWFLALESGRFWFPAQVYNRENGNVIFMMSCYDAAVRYDRPTDTFTARYLPHGGVAVTMETGITWDRIRAPPVSMSPHNLHSSDCLNDLRPGDHVEIQWRLCRVFPYGWWYGVVGHLQSCNRVNENYCLCHESDRVVLEFKQYSQHSRWRRAIINRRNHREGGNDDYGFYGGIRKLCTLKEISMWNRLWPSRLLD